MSASETQELDGWQVTAIKNSDTATSGEGAEVFAIEDADSAGEAERIVKQKPGVIRVETGLTVSFYYDEDGRMVT